MDLQTIAMMYFVGKGVMQAAVTVQAVCNVYARGRSVYKWCFKKKVSTPDDPSFVLVETDRTKIERHVLV